MIPPTSYLYVPGDRPERLTKAFNRGAGAIIADLEDAVTEDNKDQALNTVTSWLDSLTETPAPIWVRVNTGPRREQELRSLAGHPHLAGFFLPKADTPADVTDTHDLLQDLDHPKPLAPMIESATALVNIHQIAAAPGVFQLHIGEMDLAADLGLSPGPEETELLYARSLLVIASRHAGLVPPAAPVSAEITNHNTFRASTEHLKRMGYTGRDCIHPTQITITHEVYTPTPDEIHWATTILAAATENHGAYRDTAGNMVDEAILRRARNILTTQTASA
ncbi:HpcH/HpaI aldolase/citrate lyase family protein [Paenarthrobacter sp. NPDC090520]|uniref:HpcH/HpaI aldolase/citrate lyase family protein n=1 Tax=Paenarthrobacter sp. NPDC090520 TaxID=3364382 RepID=UPI00382D903B